MKKIKIVLIKYAVKICNIRTLPISDIILLTLNTHIITRSVDLGHFTTCFMINNIINTEKNKNVVTSLSSNRR